MFQKGQSGNPNGAPRKEKRFSTILGNLLEAREILINYTTLDDRGYPKDYKVHLKSDKPLYHALAVALISKALTGDNASINTIVERLEGKAEQPVSFDPEGITFTPVFVGKPPTANEAPMVGQNPEQPAAEAAKEANAPVDPAPAGV